MSLVSLSSLSAAAAVALVALSGCSLVAQQAQPVGPGANEPAWVQATADGGWAVRALTQAAACPTLTWAGGQAAMNTRTAPATVAPRGNAAQPESKSAVFDRRSCEAPWPAAAAELRVNGQLLKRPVAAPRHIVLIGDTGCRMKASEQAFQDCNDALRWPYATVARSAAAMAPDLVIHLGDFHYRESPCPADKPGCAGSPWGYGHDTWSADLFRPAAPLLVAAPWVFVRGNHESCGRAGVGWFRYLDARPWSAQAACETPEQDAAAEFTEPYAVALSADTQLIVFDSAFAAGKAYPAGSPVAARYAAQLQRVAELARNKAHNFFLNHHPVLAFGGSESGQPKPGNAGLLSVMAAAHPARLYADGVEAVLSGHVHLFQALSFATPHPAALDLGNSGSAMEGTVNPAAALRAQPAPGAVVKAYATQDGFGYATLDREADGWRITEFDTQGRPLAVCALRGSKLNCGT